MKKEEKSIEVQLFSTTNDYETNQICAILEENNIPFVKKDSGSGSYMNLYMGQSIQEKRIFVSKNDYDKSLELISSFIPSDVDNETTSETNQLSEDEDNSDKYQLIKHGLVFLILGFPVLIIILALMVSLMQN